MITVPQKFKSEAIYKRCVKCLHTVFDTNTKCKCGSESFMEVFEGFHKRSNSKQKEEMEKRRKEEERLSQKFNPDWLK